MQDYKCAHTYTMIMVEKMFELNVDLGYILFSLSPPPASLKSHKTVISPSHLLPLKEYMYISMTSICICMRFGVLVA